MKILRVIVDEVPESCKECVYPNWNSLGDRYCQAALRIIYDNKKRPNWCPLVRVVCENCNGMGWVTTISETSVDGLGSMDCPDCSGRKVDNIETIEYESESE